MENAIAFMQDIRSRVTQRIQRTTDGHAMYEVAVRAAFKWDEVHWAMLVKQYGMVDPDKVEAAHRYSRPSAPGRSRRGRSAGRNPIWSPRPTSSGRT